MPDMLVRLWQLDERCDSSHFRPPPSIRLRAPMGPEVDMAVDWVRGHFSDSWASEARVAAHRQPCALILALEGSEIVGFGCYDAARLGLAGPYGVREDRRGRGIGTPLLLRTLQAMREQGYAYAVIGDVEPLAFYAKVCGAEVIADVAPSLWHDRVRRDQPLQFAPHPSSGEDE